LHGADRNAIRSLRAWLIKALTNLCLNELTSARVRRESYPGPWLPEAVFTADGALGPLETVEQRESVSIALLTVMERLTSAERAAFVLREAFAYSHSDIADILDTSEANARQLHRRARQRLEEPKPRFRPDPAHWRALVERFLDAARGGDVNGLAAMLADHVSSTADGGGQVGAARRIVTGRDRVARYLAGGFRRVVIDVRLDFDAEVNGEQAVLAFVGPALAAVLFFDISDDRVAALRILANPDKLRFLGAQLSHPVGLPGS
jgi:RNA polymerase sigma-70 factor (ECF subfamily)